MKVLCGQTLYWHQKEGFSGSLSSKKVIGENEGKAVLVAGMKYEIVCMPERDTLDRIAVYAIASNGKAYPILEANLHYRTTDFALQHFNFGSIELDVAE